MKRKLLCAAVLAAVIPYVHAQETTWHFSCQDSAHGVTGAFDADQVLSGTFRGRELDNEGSLTMREVTYFAIDDNHGDQDTLDGGCVASTSWFVRCNIDSFAFALTGGLHISVRYGGSDELNRSWSGSFGSELEERHLWTPDTAYSISPTPPEPSAALLPRPGLAVLGTALRRHR